MRISPDEELLLAELLEEMRVTAKTLLSTLGVECAALQSGDYTALDKAGADKQALVQELERLDNERRDLLGQLLNDAPAAQQSDAILELVSGESETAANWSTLLAILAECRHFNTLNGKIVALRQQQLQRTLALLHGSSHEPYLYGPAGEVRQSSRPRSMGRT